MNRPGAPRQGDARSGAPSPSDGPESGAQPVQVSRFVRETLEAYASEQVADDLLRTALGMAGLDALPTASIELTRLIDVHLLHAATLALGPEPAEAIRQRLRPLLVVVSQIERVGTPPPTDRVTLVDPVRDERDRAPTREIELKPFSVVLLLGRDPDAASQLKQHLDARTAVIPVEQSTVLMRDLRLLRQQPRMLIVDLRRPHELLDPVRAEPALLASAVVVLWGASREYETWFKATFPGARTVRCGAEASVPDLAAIARMGPVR